MTTTRFAPSPTGHLHLGHAYAALFAFRAAQEAGGRFLVRIEDIDSVRCKPEFTDPILEDLRWLGLRWEEPVRRQAQHMDDYKAALNRLDAMGLLYPCFCTRRDIVEAGHAPHGADEAVYKGTCRHLSLEKRQKKDGQGVALRLDRAKACALAGNLTWHDRARGTLPANPALFGDIVLARKDVPTSYHLSVTVDDHLQGVTLVTRGEDLLDSTPIHRLLQALLGYGPPDYHHHKLLTDETGRRYAKRDKAVTLKSLRESGVTAEDIRRRVLS